MDSSFRSTVLSRPYGAGEGDGDGHDERDRHERHDRHHLPPPAVRDVINAGSAAHRHLGSTTMGSNIGSNIGSSTSAASFSLRSPTRSAHADSGSSFHAPPFSSPASSSNTNANTTGSGHHHHPHHPHHHNRAPGAATSPPLPSPPRPSPLHHNSSSHSHHHGNGHHRGQGHGTPTPPAGGVASPYMASSSSASAGAGGPASLPPLSSSSSSNPSTSNNHNHHHQHSAAPGSPRHAPASSASNYYPPPASSPDSHRQSHHHARDKPASGRVYDPTTDTTKERRVSDSWHNAPQNSTPKVSRCPNANPLLFLFDSCTSPLASFLLQHLSKSTLQTHLSFPLLSLVILILASCNTTAANEGREKKSRHQYVLWLSWLHRPPIRYHHLDTWPSAEFWLHRSIPPKHRLDSCRLKSAWCKLFCITFSCNLD